MPYVHRKGRKIGPVALALFALIFFLFFIVVLVISFAIGIVVRFCL